MPEPTVNWCVDSKRPPRLSSTENGPQLQANFVIAWADAFKFYNEVIGLGTVVGIGAPGASGPWRYPPEPRMVAISCEIEPFSLPPGGPPDPGASKGLAAGEYWGKASASVTFGIPAAAVQDSSVDDPANQMQFDPANPITMCTQEVEVSNEFITLPEGTYKYKGTEVSVGSSVGRRLVNAVLTLKFPRVPYIPWGHLRSFLGTINSDAVLGCQRGTLLFEGFSTTQTAQSDGTRDKTLTLKFHYRAASWNTVLRPDTGYFTEIRDRAGNPPYPEDDHRRIFHP